MDKRLRNEIAKELVAQLPLRDWAIRQEDVTGVAYAVARRISRSLRIEWEPPWAVEPAGSELLSPDAATYRDGG